MENKTQIAVIGLWHLGCTVSASLAKSGFQVQGFDFDSKLIANLNKAVLPIAEAGLSELTEHMIKAGSLNFSTDFKKLSSAEYIIIGYDTPVDDNDQPDLNLIHRAVAKIKRHANQNATVVIMSQVPAGTSRKIYEKLNREVVYNPENLRLSQAIETYLNTDRQILGISSAQAKLRMQKFYSFYKNPLLFMSLESAELVKHSINSFLGLSISFINQIADLSESLNANITDIVNGMKTDSRIGQKAFLSPGLGFAGGTLGRDLRVLENLAKEKRVELPIIVDAYKVNQSRKQIFYKKLKKVFTKLPGKKIAILGLVYKPGTNTLRRSLSLEIGKWLVKQKVQVVGFDPALKEPKAVLPIKLCDNVYNAVKGSDAVVIITEWAEFKELDYKKIQSLVAKKIIFDTKNILQPELIKNLGFKYFGTGV